MLCRGIAVIVILFWSVLTNAQEVRDSKTVDETTYELYQQKKWDELIVTGNDALKKDIDYFYLRMRIGIACYEKKRYREALVCFEKALAFNEGDPYAQSYYYYSLLYAEQYDEARKYSSVIKDASWYNDSGMRGVGLIYAEMGPKLSSRTDLYSNALYFQGGLIHTVASVFSLTHVYNYYHQNFVDGSFYQNQYYAMGNIPLGKGWSIAPAYHFVAQRFDSTIYIPAGPGRPPQTSYISRASSGSIGSFAVTRRFAPTEITIASTISGVDRYSQYIQQLTLTWYPWLNNRLSIGTILYYHKGKSYDGTFAYNPFLSYKPDNRWRFQLLWFANRHANLIERNGYFVNNSPDLTESRLTTVVDLSLNRHFSLYGLYMLENKSMQNSEKYSYSTFGLGIKFVP